MPSQYLQARSKNIKKIQRFNNPWKFLRNLSTQYICMVSILPQKYTVWTDKFYISLIYQKPANITSSLYIFYPIAVSFEIIFGVFEFFQIILTTMTTCFFGRNRIHQNSFRNYLTFSVKDNLCNKQGYSSILFLGQTSGA